MALYAIGDLHLAIGGDKPMNVFGQTWENHTEKLKKGFSKLNDDDVSVLCGDLSWAMSIDEALEDFLFIDSLPGRKIILKGNHDYWWSTATKAKKIFAEHGITTIEILNNNCFFYEDKAICGTRGWFYEEETGDGHDRKIMLREVGRLRTSLEAAGDREKLVFLHYPPIYLNYRCEEVLALLEEHNVRLCCYGHIHGKGCRASFNGWQRGTEFRLVSADHLGFEPMEIQMP